MRASISYVDDCHLSVRVDEIVSSVPTFPTKMQPLMQARHSDGGRQFVLSVDSKTFGW